MHARTPPTALLLERAGVGEAAPVRADRLLEGDPSPVAWNGYTDPTGQLCAGQWQAGPGRWRVVYEPHEEEFCVLLEGEVELTDASGRTQRFRAGDAFVVPGGFDGIWHNLTPVRKHYAIMALQHSSGSATP
ncbi:MAG TPA: cupin domain-containing protein [Burkholderiaceae bacterium]|nr:cupin domain-containing protein [Burkholderiaceae bacterium]